MSFSYLANIVFSGSASSFGAKPFAQFDLQDFTLNARTINKVFIQGGSPSGRRLFSTGLPSWSIIVALSSVSSAATAP